MSLAVLADHMASKGRGPDSMLIHMSPREVQGLQALAMKNGGSLTINPETGLPEAGFLDKLLPAIIGFGLSAATGGAINPMQAAMIVGGVQTARTGSLMEGIKAGAGAYGGAGFGAGMSTAGAESIGSQATSAATGLTGDMTFNLADAGSSLSNTLAGGETGILNSSALSDEAIKGIQQQAAERVASATPLDRISAGFDVAKANPSNLLTKDNFKYLAAAAAPVLADQAVKSNLPTTTTKPGMITPYSFFNGQYVPGQAYQAAPTKAAGGGLMGMNNGGYNPGQLDFTQQSEPVVRMAGGGIASYAGATGSLVGPSVLDASKFDQATINAALAKELGARGGTSQADLTNYAKSAYGLSDAQINAAYDTIPGFNAQGKYDAQDYIATSKPGQVSPQMVVDAAAAANPYSAQNMAKVDVTRPGHYVNDASGNPVALTHYSPGFDINNPTALTYLGDPTATDDSRKYFNQVATPAQKAEATRLYGIEKARLEAIDRAAGRLPALNADANKGLAGLNQNQNLLTNQNLTNQNLTNQNKNLNANAGLAALDPGASYTNKFFAERGLGFDPIDKAIDGFLATYKNQLAAMTPKQQEDAMRSALNVERMNEADVVKATGMTIAQLVQAKRADGSIIVPGNLKDVPVGSLPGGVSGGGNTVVNANGTITTRPDIPGIPEGGFTGMKNLRDVYTEGGGSLGYIPYTPKTIEEFNTKYVNPLKGGTKQSYDYLTGKEEYSPIPYTKDGQIAKSYNESVMKMPKASASKMYIFQNGKFVPNPDYAIPTYDKDGKKSLNLTNADVKTYMDKKPSASDFYTWATTNNLSPEQIALASDRPINEISKLFTGAKDLVGEDGKIDTSKVTAKEEEDIKTNWDEAAYLAAHKDVADELRTGKSVSGQPVQFTSGYEHWLKYGKDSGVKPITKKAAGGGLMNMARNGMSQQFDLGGYSDGGRLLRGPGDGVSDSIPATIGNKRPARLADGEFVVPARIVSELGNGSTEAGARKLYAMMDRVQAARRGTVGKGRVAKNSRAEKYLPA